MPDYLQLVLFIFAYLGFCNRHLNSLYITCKYGMSVAKNSLDNKGNSNDAIDWDVCLLFIRLCHAFQDMVNHPAFGADIDPKAGLHPATEALQALKYESEDPDGKFTYHTDQFF